MIDSAVTHSTVVMNTFRKFYGQNENEWAVVNK